MTAPSSPAAPLTAEPPEPASVTAARIEVERRRGEMLDTVHILQARLAPRTLASDAWEKAKNKGADLAEEAVDAVKARPVAIGSAAAVIGLFLARGPIRDVATRLYDAMTSSGATEKRPPALNPSPRPTATAKRRAPSKARPRRAAKTEIKS